MGSPSDPGLIPRLCDRIFERINQESDEQTTFKVEVSYMEIYNEKIFDLLGPKKYGFNLLGINYLIDFSCSKRALKVREHLLLGPMVDGNKKFLFEKMFIQFIYRLISFGCFIF